jgi:hypothetical protein
MRLTLALAITCWPIGCIADDGATTRAIVKAESNLSSEALVYERLASFTMVCGYIELSSRLSGKAMDIGLNSVPNSTDATTAAVRDYLTGYLIGAFDARQEATVTLTVEDRNEMCKKSVVSAHKKLGD